MKLAFNSVHWIITTICAVLLLGCGMVPPGMAQENHLEQSLGVDNSPMGPFRALAQLIRGEFQDGHYAKAAELAQILDRLWDVAGAHSLNHEVFEQTDKAMDEFIGPIKAHVQTSEVNGGEAIKIPDAASVEVAYKNYQEKLNIADYGSATPPASHQGIRLSPEVLNTFVGKYQPIPPSGEQADARKRPPLEITANADGLVLHGPDGPRQLVPVSDSEFVIKDYSSVRFKFEKNEQGQVTGFTARGIFPPRATKLP